MLGDEYLKLCGGPWQNGRMRRIGSSAVVVALLLSACGPSSRLEVETNSGGVLDCPSETILYAMVDGDLSKPGATTPLEAAAAWIGGEFLPDGIPSIESESGNRAIVVIVDFDGNRVGRVLMVHHETGWFVQSTAACG